MNIKYVNTELQLEYSFTKSLQHTKFEEICEKLGVATMNNGLAQGIVCENVIQPSISS